MKKELSTTASVSVRVPIRDILRRYAAVLVTTVVAAVMVGVGWWCSGDGVGIGTAMTEKIRGEGGGGVVGVGLWYIMHGAAEPHGSEQH